MRYDNGHTVTGSFARPDSVATWFHLAARREREGDFDGAFHAWDVGNQKRRSQLDVETYRAAHLALLDELTAVFPADLFKLFPSNRPSRAGVRRKGPIFVVGMPRSGSTLIEQILSSHPRVHAMGEIPVLPSIVHQHFPYQRMAPARFDDLAEAYLREVRKLGWPGWGMFTDKMLTNWQRVGIIHLLFPEAVIIHTVRDPLDTCFSCFRTAFDRGNEMAFNLADLGVLYRGYRQAMDHWSAVLPGRVVDVVHEDLIAAPEASMRLIVSACGLPWDDRCLRFYENDRKVETASADQVRRPIFTDSIGRWRNYERHLGPLFEALGPYAPTS